MTPLYDFGIARQASLRSDAARRGDRRFAPRPRVFATIRRSAGEGMIRIGSRLIRGADVRVAVPA